MSQPDLIVALRAARLVAPAELRERVRLVAAVPAAPSRRTTWRRAAVVLVPVAAAILAAVVLLPRSGTKTTLPPVAPVEQAAPTTAPSLSMDAAAKTTESARAAVGGAVAPIVPTPSATRLQRYSASLELRMPTARAVSDASKRATQIVTSLGGYPSAIDLNAGDESGYASLTFRVPRARVQEAVRRLAGLGRVVSESVRIQDLQAQVNVTDRVLDRLRSRLTALRAGPQTTETAKQIASLTAQIERRQRARAATARTAQYATVGVRLATPPVAAAAAPAGHGPLHGLGIAFRWLGIGAVYGLALGAPAAALLLAAWLVARRLRRRRVDALLSRS